MKRIYRAPWHDYKSRCIYHITLNKSPMTPAFGHLAGNSAIRPGNDGCPYVVSSATGNAVKTALRQLSELSPELKILQYALMPDHLHLLLFVEQQLDEILGRKIAAFKVMANKLAGIDHLFSRGFHDRILKPSHTLDTIFRYIRENPYRLAVRRERPEFFRRVNHLVIAGEQWQAYGNFQLLENPFKEQVVVHRADSLQRREQNRDLWLHTAANGGVLVSPFISRDEKAIRAEVEAVDAKIILLTNEAFPERFKPASHDFNRCIDGRLLIIAPEESLPPARETFLRLNSLAAKITFCSP